MVQRDSERRKQETVSKLLNSATNATISTIPTMKASLAWNAPIIGVEWPEVVGEYNGTADSEGYVLKDSMTLNASEKDKKLGSLKPV